jgi:YidC/Oxa1 family membrane protein insertase
MDRTGIIVIAICAALIGVWFYKSEQLAQQQARYQQQQQALNTNALVTAQAPAAPQAPAPAAPVFSTSTNEPEHTLVLTNQDARYTFTSHGGGIKSIELPGYPETITPRWQKQSETNQVATLNAGASFPVFMLLGGIGLMGDGDFTLTRIPGGVEAEKSLPDGLVVTKDFRLGSNYLMGVSVSLKNDSGQPLPLPPQEWVVGTAAPMDVDDLNFGYYGGAMWYDGSASHLCPQSYFSKATSFLGFFPRTPKTEFNEGNGNVVWAAAYNQFFAMMAMPPANQPAQEIVARPVDLPVTNNQSATPWTGVQTALVYPSQTLAAGQVLNRQVVLYAGPKEFSRLEKIADQFQNRCDLVMNFGTGFASFFGIGSLFAKILLLAMNSLHSLIPTVSYGWIIVLLTILLRALMWPLTASSVRSMKKMQALAPQVKALKEKYGDDQQKLMQKQMELWKENKVSPMGGCLPMLIQMPVFFGFYTMLRSAIELRGGHFLWVTDLTKPDTLFVIPGITFIPYFSTLQGLPFNLLPLMMVGVLVWQAHVQPPSPGMDPSQQKLMRYMPLIFLAIFYNYAAGMALYMTISTLAGILQTRLIKNAAPAPVVSALTPTPKKKK